MNDNVVHVLDLSSQRLDQALGLDFGIITIVVVVAVALEANNVRILDVVSTKNLFLLVWNNFWTTGTVAETRLALDAGRQQSHDQ